MLALILSALRNAKCFVKGIGLGRLLLHKVYALDFTGLFVVENVFVQSEMLEVALLAIVYDS